ncbi:SDR family NAD(P)-dependent oxidoreductase [Svornostia abyssi]|uniref:SDR family NAD(P)-dependent oxidoreductase n=1 Tax=Svornostia abyssi TaxID=2898438 RepID=A0ABY5PH14_9ACTN|nr:SDR family NAD(P)-dependent oxidoreductase [Parviterribacteraceae bacterium J379]
MPAHGHDHPVAVVVGAGPGIGTAMAVRYATAGYRTIGIARSDASLTALRAAGAAHGVDLGTATADAGNPAELTAALEQIAAAHGPIRSALYNAADLSRGRMRDVTGEQLAASLAVNVVGAQAMIQALRGPMAEAGGGTILLTGGGLALAPSPVFGPLSIGKAALRALTLVAARDLDRQGIHLATLTIQGFVAEDGDIAPARAAEALWALHEQTRDGGWDVERTLDAGG